MNVCALKKMGRCLGIFMAPSLPPVWWSLVKKSHWATFYDHFLRVIEKWGWSINADSGLETKWALESGNSGWNTWSKDTFWLALDKALNFPDLQCFIIYKMGIMATASKLYCEKEWKNGLQCLTYGGHQTAVLVFYFCCEKPVMDLTEL